MCGLFGAFAPPGDVVSTGDVDRLHDIARRSQRRGQDASGLIIVTDGDVISTAKSATGIARLLRDPAVERAVRTGTSRASSMFGHTRLATHGSIGSSKNNHPMLSDRWAVVHNGWITNHRLIAAEFEGAAIAERPETDSFAINLVLEAWSDSGEASVAPFLQRLEGELSFIAWSVNGCGMAYTNVGNLYTTSDGRTTFAASEPRFFPPSLRSAAERLDLETPTMLANANDKLMPIRPIAVTVGSRRTIDSRPLDNHRIRGRADRLTELYASVTEWSAQLDRCSRCILPVSFPHLDLDEHGVCAVCREYRRPTYGGIDALREQIDRRLHGGSREVLVGLSGGRDSCYSMHLVSELGYRPIAFTYDWGLVTNEARENMARMCGRLGTEHILVARDIQEVKRRLRGGIAALLGTPDLAVVPLLMSGDKSWMHWAQRVSRERDDLPIVMGTHRAEMTGFKSALATGRPVRASGDVDHFWKLELLPLARMAARYLAFGIREPKALPILLQDAAPGAWHYYVRNQDMVLPFDYIEWDRQVIETTIADRYGWGFDTQETKWRAGDGTAVVYNLFYLVGLGCTELDTFLSNQIRSGAVSRDEALQQVRNRPSLDTDGLIEYLDFIEADVERSLDGFIEVVASDESVRL